MLSTSPHPKHRHCVSIIEHMIHMKSREAVSQMDVLTSRPTLAELRTLRSIGSYGHKAAEVG